MRKVSLEKLISIARNATDKFVEVAKTPEHDVYRFVKALRIKEGNRRVKTRSIYMAYRFWSTSPVRYGVFKMEFSKLFTADRTCDQRFYTLNYGPLRLINKAHNIKIQIER